MDLAGAHTPGGSGLVSAIWEVRFASTCFDVFLNARLIENITADFSLLFASAYHLAGNVGRVAVIVRRMDPTPLDLAGLGVPATLTRIAASSRAADLPLIDPNRAPRPS